jgi:hypothetical protein
VPGRFDQQPTGVSVPDAVNVEPPWAPEPGHAALGGHLGDRGVEPVQFRQPVPRGHQDPSARPPGARTRSRAASCSTLGPVTAPISPKCSSLARCRASCLSCECPILSRTSRSWCCASNSWYYMPEPQTSNVLGRPSIDRRPHPPAARSPSGQPARHTRNDPAPAPATRGPPLDNHPRDGPRRRRQTRTPPSRPPASADRTGSEDSSTNISRSHDVSRVPGTHRVFRNSLLSAPGEPARCPVQPVLTNPSESPSPHARVA